MREISSFIRNEKIQKFALCRSMKIFLLNPINTFSIDAKARFFNSFSLVEELEETPDDVF